MTLDKPNPNKLQLKEVIQKIDWGIQYGWVKVKITNGKPTLLTVETSDRIV